MTEKQKQLNRINSVNWNNWPFKKGSYEYHFDIFFDLCQLCQDFPACNDFEADEYALTTMELELKLMEDERAENSIQSNQGAGG
jgi:hypothetical protein